MRETRMAENVVLREGSRRAIKAGLQLAVNEYTPSDDDYKLIGAVLYAISSDNPVESLNLEKNDEIVAQGWHYYEGLADSDGNLEMDGFQVLFNRSVRMLFESLKLGDAAVDTLRKLGSALDWTPTAEIENSFKTEILNKTENAFPVLAQALFRFFGEILIHFQDSAVCD